MYTVGVQRKENQKDRQLIFGEKKIKTDSCLVRSEYAVSVHLGEFC